MVQKTAVAASIVLLCVGSQISTPRAMAQALPASTSPDFCVAVQQKIASTTQVGENTVFKDMPSYRHSKPAIQPLKIFQVVTYAARTPIVVSCKMKTAAHLRAIYGPSAAGEQLFCPDIARVLQQQAIDELQNEGRTDAAQRLAKFVVDRDEPFISGQAYLTDFRTLYNGADGAVHISSPGLYQNYDSWYTVLLPEIVQGQSYCHLATVESLKAVALGEMSTGATITTDDDAPTQPQ